MAGARICKLMVCIRINIKKCALANHNQKSEINETATKADIQKIGDKNSCWRKKKVEKRCSY